MEAICFQTKDVLMAIESSIGTKLRKLNVDGPVASNNLLMQLQADLSGLSVCKFLFEMEMVFDFTWILFSHYSCPITQYVRKSLIQHHLVLHSWPHIPLAWIYSMCKEKLTIGM